MSTLQTGWTLSIKDATGVDSSAVVLTVGATMSGNKPPNSPGSVAEGASPPPSNAGGRRCGQRRGHAKGEREICPRCRCTFSRPQALAAHVLAAHDAASSDEDEDGILPAPTLALSHVHMPSPLRAAQLRLVSPRGSRSRMLRERRQP